MVPRVRPARLNLVGPRRAGRCTSGAKQFTIHLGSARPRGSAASARRGHRGTHPTAVVSPASPVREDARWGPSGRTARAPGRSIARRRVSLDPTRSPLPPPSPPPRADAPRWDIDRGRRITAPSTVSSTSPLRGDVEPPSTPRATAHLGESKYVASGVDPAGATPT